MKTLSPLLWCVCVLLMVFPATVLADDDTAPSQTAPSDGANPGPGAGQRGVNIRALLAQLNLTGDQKQQIKQIMQTVPAGPQRRRQILAVLTPEQKQKLRQLLHPGRNGGGAAVAGNNGNGGGNDQTDDVSDLSPGAN
jgi:Spy/CpxP family protein refolding chaperone